MRFSTLLLGLLLAAVAWWFTRPTAPSWTWKEAKISKTDVKSLVTATGSVEAVTTVTVGTQVSGIVAERLVDYNAPVHKGQLLARIDPTLAAADVEAAEARLASARANAHRLLLEKERILSLQSQKAATQQEVEQVLAEFDVAQSEVRSSEVALRRQHRNLSYTEIVSPIDGVVIQRSVDPGQTVNAGFSAPTLFVLAGDLASVQVVASIDEADVGKVKEGQSVDVTVQAWPGQVFPGKVVQLRLQSKLVDNVVTYPAVVSVENPGIKLRPGMTASLEFLVDQALDAFCAPNAALRFRPEAPMLAPGEALSERKGKRQVSGFRPPRD